jgi:hypothetical protein
MVDLSLWHLIRFGEWLFDCSGVVAYCEIPAQKEHTLNRDLRLRAATSGRNDPEHLATPEGDNAKCHWQPRRQATIQDENRPEFHFQSMPP